MLPGVVDALMEMVVIGENQPGAGVYVTYKLIGSATYNIANLDGHSHQLHGP